MQIFKKVIKIRLSLTEAWGFGVNEIQGCTEEKSDDALALRYGDVGTAHGIYIFCIRVVSIHFSFP